MTTGWATALTILLVLLSTVTSNANELYVNQVGDRLNLKVVQKGPGNRTDLVLTGNDNTVDTSQHVGTNTLGYQWITVDIAGDSNNTTLIQQDYDNKYMNIDIVGDNNTVSVLQKDDGPYTTNVSLTGNDHSVTGIQAGTGSHSSDITLTNAGGAYSVYFEQVSSTTQSYTFTGFCANTAGCSAVVTQY
jgi:hypothetical protein